MAKKGNKEVLLGVNQTLNIIKRIKADEMFTPEEKMDILDKFIGMSEDNNSYFTPLEVCTMMKDMLPIDEAISEGKEVRQWH